MGGTNHSHATKDLYDAIGAGDYPEWTLMVQVGGGLGFGGFQGGAGCWG